MLKAVVVDETPVSRHEARPNIPWEDTIIYEAHVKGLTQLREDVPPQLRGTFGALSSPAVIDHLKRLGVTTIELLPIHAMIDDRVLVEKKLTNERFISNAKAEVIALEKKKQSDAEARIRLLTEQLEALKN